MSIDIFADVKRLVKPREVAERYGLTPNRRGYICCPFHGERTPSLKLYPDSWYCFGCMAGGSVIDFVARMEGYSRPLDAAKKLIADFHLPLSVGAPLTPDECRQAQDARRERQRAAVVDDALADWIDQTTDRLAVTYRTGHLALKRIRGPDDIDKLTANDVLSIRWMPEIEWMLDELMSGDPQRILEILRTYGRYPLHDQQENKEDTDGRSTEG